MREPRLRIHPRRTGRATCDGHRGHFDFFLYIASMRWVTRKPPKMFTLAKMSATKPKPLAQPLPEEIMPTPTASSAPTTITDEIAFVTDISGVWSAGVTDHTTK